jgi:hypothetical protein
MRHCIGIMILIAVGILASDALSQNKRTPIVPDTGRPILVLSTFCETQDQIERFSVLRSAGYQLEEAVARVNVEFASVKPPCEHQWRSVWKPVFLEKWETHAHAIMVYAVTTHAGLRFTLLEQRIYKA